MGRFRLSSRRAAFCEPLLALFTSFVRFGPLRVPVEKCVLHRIARKTFSVRSAFVALGLLVLAATGGCPNHPPDIQVGTNINAVVGQDVTLSAAQTMDIDNDTF